MWEPDCHAYSVKIVLLGNGKKCYYFSANRLVLRANSAFALKSEVSERMGAPSAAQMFGWMA